MYNLEVQIKKLWENAGYTGAIIPKSIIDELPKGKKELKVDLTI
jgi:hypothetical protein